ncbi:Uncharacterised protein [Streptococcus pneumoniae]|nr:Uncharacterised protein [Streptococcus pneumoniae]
MRHKKPTGASFCWLLILKVCIEFEGLKSSLFQQDIIGQDLIGPLLMYFIVATKGTVSLLDKESQLMHDGVRSFVLICIPKHGKIFRIFMVGIAREYFICLVGRVHVKDENSLFIQRIVHVLKDVPYFHLILHIADRVRITRDKIVFPCLGQIQHITFYKSNLLLG